MHFRDRDPTPPQFLIARKVLRSDTETDFETPVWTSGRNPALTYWWVHRQSHITAAPASNSSDKLADHNPQCYDLWVSQPPKSATAITVLNLKGGVGKTHTAWLLAGVCAERGYRCLCVDLDTQGNLTRNLLVDESPIPGVELLFHPGNDGEASEAIRSSTLPHVDLIPSSPAVAAFDLADQRQWEAADLQRSLHDALARVQDHYDYIICDCPPRLSLLSFAALVASDHVIIPLEAADWGAQGVTQVTEAVRYVQRRENDKLNLMGYLISRFKTARSYQHSYLAKLREHFGDLAFDTVVPDLAGFEKSVTHAIPVNLRAPSSREAAIARQLFDEVERRIRQNCFGGTPSGRANVSGIPAAGL